ncbi:MAG: polyhydroxyalkanoic acid system family protein, partial [Proteobacteria bacterium]|nr:polyhydroxyalkanoic acid system family protein [Pseudomonadota bacterium]
MASIDIRRRHSLSPERARGIVEDVVSGLSGKLGLRGAWEGNRFEF